jgi:Ulp1 family protease
MDKRKKTINVSRWKRRATGLNGPQQVGVIDCGVFAAMSADFLSDDLPLQFSQNDIPLFRNRMVASILRGELDYAIE